MARFRLESPAPFPEILATAITEGKRALLMVPTRLPAGILDTPSALPEIFAATKLPAIVTTPCSVGLVFNTILPEPVEVETPVPP